MTYTPRTRDRYQLAVRTTTAIVAAGAIAATGWITGAAAQTAAAQQTSKDAAATQAALRSRPTKLRVTTRYVTEDGSVVSLGNGGTVSTPGQPGSANPAPAAPSNGS